MGQKKKLLAALLLFFVIFIPVCAGVTVPEKVNAASVKAVKYRNEFVRKNGKWYYFDTRGKLVKGWFTSAAGNKYYFGKTGAAHAGILTIGKNKYCFNEKGKMLKCWQKVNGKAYFFDEKDGHMHTGWTVTEAGNRYYFWKDGVIRPGWQKVSGKLYYFNTKGKMIKNSFLTVSGKKYYLDGNGQIKKGWLTLKNKTYCMHPRTGVLQTGWVTYQSKKYYLSPSDGTLLKNQWIDRNHYVGSDGAWIKGYGQKKLSWPLSSTWNTITSDYGDRESPGGIGSTNHGGIDIYAPTGTPIYAPASGIILAMQKPAQSNGGGYYTILDHGDGIYTEYMHQSKFAAKLKPGMRVSKGQIIGYVGATGNVTGPHLHFGVMVNGIRKDPMDFVVRPE